MNLEELEQQNHTFVYWIHEQNHDDPRTQGYVGITDRLVKRFSEHHRYPNHHVRKALKEHDDLSFTILHYGSREECLNVEQQLRPVENVAWNLKKGGRHEGIHITTKKSPELVENLRRRMLNNTFACALKGRKQSPEHIAKRVAAIKAKKINVDI